MSTVYTTKTHVYDILIANFNSSGIRAGANGATHMRLIGCGQYDGRDGNDNQVCFYALPDMYHEGCEYRVANTNGDPVWEEQDEAEFEELAEHCGVTL